MEELLRLEEVLWKQRLKVEWLMYVDRNTTFFHRKTSHQKQVNTTKKIQDDDGNVYRNVEDIGEVLTKYFSDLFTSSPPLMT